MKLRCAALCLALAAACADDPAVDGGTEQAQTDGPRGGADSWDAGSERPGSDATKPDARAPQRDAGGDRPVPDAADPPDPGPIPDAAAPLADADSPPPSPDPDAAPAPPDPDGGADPRPPPEDGRFSRWARPGDDGRLQYRRTDEGDRLPDFSYAGYGGGGVAIPDAPVRVTLDPEPRGDDGARIQAAIDEVAALPLDADGLRGAVLLRRGTYRIAGQLRIRSSGVVLRGEGRGADGSVLHATGREERTLVQVGGDGRPREVRGTRQRIIDDYVPVGARRFRVDEADAFAPGDRVIVHRPSTQEWIDFVGMDACDRRGGTRFDESDESGSTCLGGAGVDPWEPGTKDQNFDRVVVAVDGREVEVDAPLTTAIDARFGGGAIYRAEFPGRVTQVGVEDIRGDSDFDGPTDEDHAWTFVEVRWAEDAWVRRVKAVHYAWAAVSVVGNARRVTVEDSRSANPVSEITGGRRYAFNIDDAQLVLFARNESRDGRHDYVLGSTTPGPNVFLDGLAERANAEIGPHHRWSSGVLFDNITSDDAIAVRNRGNSGSGHGWAGANCVVWNSTAPEINVGNPPGAHNWAIGNRTDDRRGDGEWDQTGAPVWPPSLYLRQLEERLVPAAVAAIGF